MTCPSSTPRRAGDWLASADVYVVLREMESYPCPAASRVDRGQLSIFAPDREVGDETASAALDHGARYYCQPGDSLLFQVLISVGGLSAYPWFTGTRLGRGCAAAGYFLLYLHSDRLPGGPEAGSGGAAEPAQLHSLCH